MSVGDPRFSRSAESWPEVNGHVNITVKITDHLLLPVLTVSSLLLTSRSVIYQYQY